VNRLIRSEYLPLYYYRGKVFVELEDIGAYSKVFLRVGVPHLSRPSTVVVGNMLDLYLVCDLAEITALLKLAAKNPEVHFIYHDYVDFQGY
jgi:hypothetical protein